MNLVINECSAPYEVAAISSKSWLHRALVCASLSREPVKIRCRGTGTDVEETVAGLQNLGFRLKVETGSIMTEGRTSAVTGTVSCAQSASSFHFLLPFAAACGISAEFHLGERLAGRPHTPLIKALTNHGCTIRTDGFVYSLFGKLEPGEFFVSGDISSQYVSGLLMALPVLDSDSTIHIIGKQVSYPYIELTVSVMRLFGIYVKKTSDGWFVPGNQIYTANGELQAEPDWSNAAPFLAAGAVGKHPVTVTDLFGQTSQGDSAIIPLLEQFGAKVEDTDAGITVFPSALSGIYISASQIPDLVPILALCGAFAAGTTVFSGISFLRYKESNRIESVADAITSLGGHADVSEDSLIITGGGITGGTVDAKSDHRIAMLAAVAAAGCQGTVTVLGAECVSKSFPGYFSLFSFR